MAQHIFINGTATTTETTGSLEGANVYFVSNDETSGGDLHLDFYDTMANDTDYMVIKPGESFENLETECKTLYYKSSTSTVSFRVYGRKY